MSEPVFTESAHQKEMRERRIRQNARVSNSTFNPASKYIPAGEHKNTRGVKSKKENTNA